MNIYINLTETTAYYFCRFSGIKRKEYQEVLFECGCNYAETYSRKNFSSQWKIISEKITNQNAFWNWWKQIWSLQILDLLKAAGISESTKELRHADTLFLIRAFYALKNSCLFFPAQPENSVLETLKIQAYENTKPCKIIPVPDTNTAGKKHRRKNRSAEQRNPGNRKFRRPAV